MKKEFSGQVYWQLIALSFFIITLTYAEGRDYGMPGPYKVTVDTVVINKSTDRNFYVYYPKKKKKQYPCVLFYPKFGVDDANDYRGILHHSIFLLIYL